MTGSIEQQATKRGVNGTGRPGKRNVTRRVVTIALLLFSNLQTLAQADGALVLCEDTEKVELRQDHCRDGERMVDWSQYREMATPPRVVLARDVHAPEEGIRMAVGAGR